MAIEQRARYGHIEPIGRSALNNCTRAHCARKERNKMDRFVCAFFFAQAHRLAQTDRQTNTRTVQTEANSHFYGFVLHTEYFY